jgi:hypothetical protein
MSQQLTLELSDEVYADLQQKADALGLSIAEWVVTLLSRQNDPAEINALSATQKEQVRQQFMSFAGAVNLGYATGIDNEVIDADLARAYSNDY